MLSEAQKKTAQAIVNIFETSQAQGNYSDVTLIKGDKGHLSYGRLQVTLTSGNLHKVVDRYCKAPGALHADGLRPYLTRLAAKDIGLDTDGELKSLLKRAGADPVMQRVQDDYCDANFWEPAASAAAKVGITQALGVAVVYDSHIHGGWPTRRDETNKAGLLFAVGEKPWVSHYIRVRRNWLATHPRQDLRNTVYRMDEFQKLIDRENWELGLPITVRGVLIDATVLSLARPLKIVMLADNSLIECHAQVEEGTTRVDLRPLCNALKIELPSGAALEPFRPEVVPPGVTRVDLRALAEANGWELLTHKMAEDGKIYLRKRGS